MFMLIWLGGAVMGVGATARSKKAPPPVPQEEREIVDLLDQTGSFEEAHYKLLELEKKRPLHPRTCFAVGIAASRTGMYQIACYYLLGYLANADDELLAKKVENELMVNSLRLQGWREREEKPDEFLMLWGARILLGRREYQACLDKIQQFQQLLKVQGIDTMPLNAQALCAEAHFGLKNYHEAGKYLAEVKKAAKGKLPANMKSLADALDTVARKETSLETAKKLAESGKVVEAISQYESLWRAQPREILAGVRAVRLNLQAKQYSRAFTMAEEMQTWLAKQEDEKSKVYLTQVDALKRQCKILATAGKALRVDAGTPKVAVSQKKSPSKSPPKSTSKKPSSMADQFLRNSGK